MAIKHYQVVAGNLRAVAEVYPWLGGASADDVLPVDDNSRTAVDALRGAREAEAAGLSALEEIIAAL
jgi:hypothetical protein